MSTFAVDIKKFTEKVRDRQRFFLNKLLVDIHAGVVYMTPTDYGHAQANWNVGINNVDLTDQPPDENPESIKQRVASIIKQVVVGDVIYISNNTDYIEVLDKGLYPNPPKKGTYLKKNQTKGSHTGPGYFKFSEGGYSKQARAGMVAVTLRRFEQLVEVAVKDAKVKVP